MSSEEWDARYGAADQMWSGRPNGALVVEVADLAAGTALDVGCGEGGDAIWLAQRGWRVTGLDVSQVALDRAAAAARERGVDVEWVCSPLEEAALDADGYDLVAVHYPALPSTPQRSAERALLEAVAPGGLLLFVGHALIHSDHAHEHGFVPDDFVSAHDVHALLGPGWDVEVHEERPRVDPPPGAEHVRDVVLRARRTA